MWWISEWFDCWLGNSGMRCTEQLTTTPTTATTSTARPMDYFPKAPALVTRNHPALFNMPSTKPLAPAIRKKFSQPDAAPPVIPYPQIQSSRDIEKVTRRNLLFPVLSSPSFHKSPNSRCFSVVPTSELSNSLQETAHTGDIKKSSDDPRPGLEFA